MSTAALDDELKTTELVTVGDRVVIADNEPYCAFTDISRLDDGTLLMVYSAGRSHVDQNMHIDLRRSVDEGQTWSEPTVLVEPINAGYGVRDPHLGRLDDGRLILTWFSYYEKDVYDSIIIHMRHSDDGGQTWSEPTAIPRPAELRHGMAMSNHVIELEDGRVLLSVYGPKQAQKGPEICGVLVSDDRGESWPTFHKIHEEPTQQGMEAELAQLDDGRLVALIRRTNKTTGLRGVSEDGGKTWSEPEAVPVGHAPGILVDGDIMLVNHRARPDGQPASMYGGKGTVVSLSRDAGRSFVAHLPLGFPIRTYGGDTAYGGIVKLSGEDYYTTYYSTASKGVKAFGQRFRVVR